MQLSRLNFWELKKVLTRDSLIFIECLQDVLNIKNKLASFHSYQNFFFSSSIKVKKKNLDDTRIQILNLELRFPEGEEVSNFLFNSGVL